MTLSQNSETIKPVPSLRHWQADILFVSRLEILKSLREQRDYIVQVPDNSIIGHGEDGSLIVFIDGHCNASISNPYGVLNLAGDANRDDQSGAGLFAREADQPIF